MPELGGRFYDVIDQLIAEACQTPGTFRYIRKPVRRHFTHEFPYGIIYVERPNDIWILAVMPLRRELLEAGTNPAMKRRRYIQPPLFDAEGYQTNLSYLNGTPL